jgi:5-(carboxyamino)imidazole ribonucleotide synthase
MSTIGVLGAGQLGRMLALAGYPLGLRFRFLDSAAEAPAGDLAERLRADFDDLTHVDAFTDGLHRVTYEFENVPLGLAEALARRVPVYPPPAALAASQDRLAEKTLFRRLGLPTAPFARVDGRADLERAVAEVGLPALLKTRRYGYDGKGQFLIREAGAVAAAWDRLGGVPLLLEGFVPFDRELSQIAVRGPDGSTAFYPLVENRHAAGILRLSQAPAPELTPDVQAQSVGHARRVLEELAYVGVLTIEFFEEKGRLLANEMAPRVHNSGHWTIEGAQTSQFENHLRAILGWPLGPTAVRAPCLMLNLIGAVPEPAAVLAIPGAHLHLYGKTPRPGRKLGHVTLCAGDAGQMLDGLRRLRALVPAEPAEDG